jgi:general secretion pathway protein L
MNTWLYLTAEGLDAPANDWPCYLWSAAGGGQHLPLDDLASMLQGQEVDLLLPMEMCSWVRSDPWPTQRKPQAQALAFAVEDQLGQPLEDVHLSMGARDPDGGYPVLVIARDRLAAVLALLTDAGIEVRAVFVDADVLPGSQALGAWCFGRWLLGGGASVRMAVSSDSRAQLAGYLPKDIQWLEESAGEVDLDQWLANRPARAINLLQGAFARRRRQLPWRLGGCVLLSLALMGWAASETRIRFLTTQSQDLAARNEQQFRVLYPDQNRIGDVAAQLAALQNRPVEPQQTRVAGLVRLIEQVIGASEVEVQRIEFRAGDGWRIQLTANSFAELEQLRERGRQQGPPVRIESASKAQERVRATLIVEEEA